MRGFGDGPVHLVGHSLGGLVILEAFGAAGELSQGRVVLLGSPVQGSRAARAVAAWSLGPHLLGRLAAAELTRCEPRTWRGERELGIIAGSRSAGMGRLFAKLPAPNDGTVSVDETRITGAREHIVHDVSHTGMLMSAVVADSLVKFLNSGSFGS
jgi:pimeloyl-ACP methyl ester carboxylesterase